jgi:hypothetical protein
MPPKKVRKTSPLQAVAAYDLRKVWVPYVAPDGSSSYAPRKTKAKATLLRERLLTRACQKKERTGSSTQCYVCDAMGALPGTRYPAYSWELTPETRDAQMMYS